MLHNQSIFAAAPRRLLQFLVCILTAASIFVLNGAAFSQTMKNDGGTKKKGIKFYDALDDVLTARGAHIETLYDARDATARRILEEYGAMFVAAESVLPPPVCIFRSEAAVAEFQAQMQIGSAEIGGATIELQQAALDALLAARDDARKKGFDITPRDGAEAARRSFADSLRLWNSRFARALEHWRKLRKISDDEAEKLNALAVREQVGAVLKLEQNGIFFSTYFDKSILYSVAAPGASQHLALLAFDANEFAAKRVRKILARHGWFRTVKNDEPHFTFLGVPEKDLTPRGLKKIKTDAGEFWIPNV